MDNPPYYQIVSNVEELKRMCPNLTFDSFQYVSDEFGNAQQVIISQDQQQQIVLPSNDQQVQHQIIYQQAGGVQQPQVVQQPQQPAKYMIQQQQQQQHPDENGIIQQQQTDSGNNFVTTQTRQVFIYFRAQVNNLILYGLMDFNCNFNVFSFHEYYIIHSYYCEIVLQAAYICSIIYSSERLKFVVKIIYVIRLII